MLGTEHTEKPRRSILVVEDERVVLEFVARVLQQEGYNVLRARDGEEACVLFHHHAPKLALMVVATITPRMSGTAFIAHLPTLDPRIPVLFMTRLGEYEVKQQFRDLPFPVLLKPFYATDLRAKIKAVALPITPCSSPRVG